REWCTQTRGRPEHPDPRRQWDLPHFWRSGPERKQCGVFRWGGRCWERAAGRDLPLREWWTQARGRPEYADSRPKRTLRPIQLSSPQWGQRGVSGVGVVSRGAVSTDSRDLRLRGWRPRARGRSGYTDPGRDRNLRYFFRSGREWGQCG